MHGVIIYTYNKGTFFIKCIFLATESDRRMRLLTRVYGIIFFVLCMFFCTGCLNSSPWLLDLLSLLIFADN